MRPISSVDRVRRCRKVTITGTGGPVLRVTGTRGAGYAGLETCGSVWSCPCCAPKIASRRAAELADVMAAVHRAEGSAFLVTLTMRHHSGHRLRDLWEASAAGWGRVISGKAWVADAAGLLGWCRVVEVTHSPLSGWHVHIHALLAWDHDVTDDHAQHVAMRAWGRWDRALRRRGLDSTPVRGVDARRVRVGSEGLDSYLVKAAREVTSAHAKVAKGGGRSPFALLRDAVDTYRADDIELWWAWERASHGRKQMTWSTGRRDLRAFAGLGREATDEEVAAEETGGTDVVALTGDAWEQISRGGLASDLLDVAEADGVTGATSWLDARGLGWAPARGRPPRSMVRPGLSPQTEREARAVLGSLALPPPA